MGAAAYSTDQTRSRRRRRRCPDLEEIEAGEIVHGYDDSGSETEDDDSRYVFKPRNDDGGDGGSREGKRRLLEDVVVGGQDAPPSPMSPYGSDETISDDDDGAAALAQPLFFPCPVCRREFRSKMAVHGHMRVHDPHGRQGQEKGKERPVPVVSGGWAVTGKRGFVGGSRGGTAVSVKDEEVDNSMAIVVAEPNISVLDPMSMAFARSNHESSSAEQNPNESMAIVVAVDNPSNEVVLDPPAVPQFVEHQSAAPLVVADRPAAAVEQGQPARGEGWFCKAEGCNKWYPTHQGLGGHMAGHKNRQNEAAAAAAGICRVSTKPRTTHACKVCGKVFLSGVALGGHMRMHYDGKVRPKKRGALAVVEAQELAQALLSVQASQEPIAAEEPEPELELTLSLWGAAPPAVKVEQPAIASASEAAGPAEPEPELALTLSLWTAPAMEVEQPAIASACETAEPEPAPVPVTEVAQPAPAPVVAGIVRIFGVNLVHASAAEEVSSAVTDAGSSSSANIP